MNRINSTTTPMGDLARYFGASMISCREFPLHDLTANFPAERANGATDWRGAWANAGRFISVTCYGMWVSAVGGYSSVVVRVGWAESAVAVSGADTFRAHRGELPAWWGGKK